MGGFVVPCSKDCPECAKLNAAYATRAFMGMELSPGAMASALPRYGCTADSHLGEPGKSCLCGAVIIQPMSLTFVTSKTLGEATWASVNAEVAELRSRVQNINRDAMDYKRSCEEWKARAEKAEALPGFAEVQKWMGAQQGGQPFKSAAEFIRYLSSQIDSRPREVKVVRVTTEQLAADAALALRHQEPGPGIERLPAGRDNSIAHLDEDLLCEDA